MLRFNFNKRLILLTGEIRPSTSAALISKLLKWDDLGVNKKNIQPIKLYINSEGGEVQGGLLAIYDVIQSLNSPVETFCVGQAYSSAAILVATGSPGKRHIFPNATMMLHPPFTEILGTTKEISINNFQLEMMENKLWKILGKHTKKRPSEIAKQCQTDRYFSAKEALQYGLVDKIISSK